MIGKCIVTVALFLSFALPGCSSSDAAGASRNLDCVSLCKEGQSGNCTSIKGDCQAFCDALTRNVAVSNCAEQKSAYYGCLNAAATTCAASCDSQDTSLQTCVGAYCTKNLTDADCKTLISSL